MSGLAPWKCCGCGRESADRVRNCDCPTACLYRAGEPKSVLKLDESEAQALARERLHDAAPALLEALRRIADAPAWGAPDRWETTPDEVRQLARKAISLATGESK